MKIVNVTDDYLNLDSDGFIWVKSVDDSEYHLIGKSENKRVKIDNIDEVFKNKNLNLGKYHYFYTKGIDDDKLVLNSDKLETIIHAKNTDRQKSFFKPQDGVFTSFVPKRKNYKYKFSIIMAVYNIEEFLSEAVDSVMNQTEKSVELILINDGSTDNSGAQAREYADKYENIVYLEQENGGVASARNLGLKHATGEFINFMDPDDIISDNTLEKVYNFFKPRKHITDVVSIPIYFFGDQSGAHPLNDKFKKGTRIINLLDSDQSDILLSLSTAFVVNEAIIKNTFDTSLKIGEDLKLVNNILLDKLTLGVVKEARYNYRRVNNFGALKNTQAQMTFEETQKRFMIHHDLIKSSLDLYGTVLKYIQWVIIYDLNWQFKASKFINDSVLSDEEKIEIRDDNIYSIFEKYIDIELIKQSTRLSNALKLKLINKRADYLNTPVVSNRMGTWRGNDKIASLFDIKTTFVTANVSEKNKRIQLIYTLFFHTLISNMYPNFEENVVLQIGKTKIKPASLENDNVNKNEILYENILEGRMLIFNIDLNDIELLDTDIKINIDIPNGIKMELKTNFNKTEFSSLGPNITMDSISDNYVSKLINGHMQIGIKGEQEQEKLISEAFGDDHLKKYQYALSLIYKKKPIWIFEDRPDSAGDNAEALFEYVVNNHKEIDAYFVLQKDSKDWDRLNSIGKVLEKFSDEHVNIWTICDVVVSAHAEYQILNPYSRAKGQNWRNYFKGNRILNKPKFVFLQHGISRSTHHMNKWLNRINKNISLFLTSTIYESEEFLNEGYHYSNNEIKLLGMPRHDKLINNIDKSDKIILFTPTWRKYLANVSSEEFIKTEYFRQINHFINDKKLNRALKHNGYKIAFKIHPNLMRFANLFNLKKNIYLPDSSYSDLFIQSKIAITDFSSTVLDFGFMKKSIIQYQFDDVNYFNGHTFTKDNSEEKAIYGNVYTNGEYDKFISELIGKMHNPEMDKKFQDKVDQDFPYRDGKNRERVFNAILELSDNDYRG